MVRKKLLASLLLAPIMAFGVNFDTLTPNTWAQIATSGQYPNWGVETHLAFDTSGYAYMIGSCSYGGSAAGTHNNEIFRFDIKTGQTSELYACGTNPWPGGCQAGQVFDPSRNCIWFGPGQNSACRTTGVLWFPGLAYYGGLYRMQCPDGPLEKIRDGAVNGKYYLYDEANDLLIGVSDNNYHGCRLYIYDIEKDSVYSKPSPAPFTQVTSGWTVPCCFDTKRGLVVTTRWGSDTSGAARSVWFYNTTTQVWSSKTPAAFPPAVNVTLTYEPVMDKYVLFGTDPAGFANTGDWHPQVWAYDYDSNTWTQRLRGRLSYDTLDRAASTWPPLRSYPGSIGYSPKHGVLANWGGLPLSSVAPRDNNTKQPLWTFKLGESEGSAISAVPAKKETPALLSASPNPFNPSVTLRLTGTLKPGTSLRIFDTAGRLVADLSGSVKSGKAVWDASGFTGGIYLAALSAGNVSLTKKLVLAR